MQTISKINIAVITLLALALSWLGVVSVSGVGAVGTNDVCQGASLSLSQSAGDACKEPDVCTRTDNNGVCTRKDPASEAKLNNLITAIVNIFSVVVGIIAVIAVIVGGLKFITSGGDSGKVSSAKSTVIYAIVGLIIVALAQFIVRFVLAKIK